MDSRLRVISLTTIAILLVVALPCFAKAHTAGDLFIATMTGGSIVFNLPGATGTFQENMSADYAISIRGSKKVAIRFEASDLSYIGDEQASLNAIYWLGGDKRNTFSSGKPLVLRRVKGSHTFSLHGQVTIDAVEAQPAGEYKGTITITVFEDRG